MKKIISIVLALMIVLSLCACAPGGEGGGTDSKSTFQVGYGREKMMPETSVPLGGYGRAESRMSTGFLDYLYATCIAITDSEGNTVLLMSTDATRSLYEFRGDVSAATGIPEDHIYMNGTHTHSAPAVGLENPYEAIVKKAHVNAAQKALEDRQPAEIYYGTSKSEGLNFVRHYLMEDGTYAGDNFGNHNQPYVKNATEVDPTIHIVKFDRGEEHKPIVLMNWRAHPTITGGSDKYDISADYVGSLREYMEKTLSCNFIYVQGAAGNVNPRSRIKEDTPTDDYKLYGQQLGGFALQAMENMEKLETGTIQTQKMTFSASVDHSRDHLLKEAQEIEAMWNSGASFSQCASYGQPYGIRSPYMAESIIKNYNQGETMDLELNVIALGDQLAFCTASNEIFDSTGAYVEEKSCFDKTIFLSCTNGHKGYIPSAIAFEYTCYETDNTRYVPGTAETLADHHLAMLKALKGE